MQGMCFGTEIMPSTDCAKSSRVRLLLVDDDERVLNQMSLLLSDEFEIAGRSHDGEQMVTDVERLNPDVIVADISMPGLDGIDATRMILGRHPDALVILFTMHQEPDVVHRALEAGARGYVYKLQGIDDVIKAIHSVLRGEDFVSSGCLN